MRRLPTLVLAALLACVLATPAHAAFFPGDTLDGPSPDIRALGDLDLARDGTGALVWVRALDGVDRIFVSRFEGGAFQPIERIDTALPGRSSQPGRRRHPTTGGSRSSSSTGARCTASCGPAPAQPYAAPVPLAPGLAIRRSTCRSTARRSPRSPRPATYGSRAWIARRTRGPASRSPPTSIRRGSPASATGRSKVAISADGIGVVTWGEGGHVFARKMFHEGISNAPQDLTPAGLRRARLDGLRPARRRHRGRLELRLGRLSPDLRRRRLADRSRAASAARRSTRRSRSTPATSRCAIRASTSAGAGRGSPTSIGATSGQPIAALIDKRDAFAARRADPHRRALWRASPRRRSPRTTSRSSRRFSRARRAPRRRWWCGRSTTASPAVTTPPCRVPSSGRSIPRAASTRRRTAPAARSSRGCRAPPEARRIVAGYNDRPPSAFLGYTGQGCCRGVSPTLKWQTSFNIWGPTRYEVMVDGVVVGTTANTSFDVPTPLKAGTHTWQVRAIDVRSQAVRSKRRILRIDGHKPLLTVHYRRKKRIVVLAARARDDASRGGSPPGWKASSSRGATARRRAVASTSARPIAIRAASSR